MITDPAQFFTQGCGRCGRFDTPDCSALRWAGGLAALRDLCRGAGLEEQAKWGHPCYVHAGRNIALLGAFRDDFRLTFMNAALLDDPLGILQHQGPNSRTPDALRFTEAGQVAPLAPAIAALLAQSMRHAEAGTRPARSPAELDLPPELLAALDDDPELAEGFAALTPGRQRSWVIHLTTSRNPATRMARITKGRERILQGKGATER